MKKLTFLAMAVCCCLAFVTNTIKAKTTPAVHRVIITTLTPHQVNDISTLVYVQKNQQALQACNVYQVAAIQNADPCVLSLQNQIAMNAGLTVSKRIIVAIPIKDIKPVISPAGTGYCVGTITVA